MTQPTHSSTIDFDEAPSGVESAGLALNASVTQPSEKDVIASLALLSPMEYDRARKEQAKLLGVQVKTLDTLVKAARNEVSSNQDSILFADIDPCEEPVEPAELLDGIVSFIQTYIVLSIEQANAVALWIVFTWFIDDVDIAPLLLINAPEKSCGKSQLLDLVSQLSCKSLSASNCSTSALFRACELYGPTLFIDEADTFIRENNEIKGLINAGHTRSNAYVIRVTGENHEPKMYRVWGAKAFAGISLEKHLPDATMSRGIVIQLRRKLSHESVSRLRHANKDLFTNITSKLARFSEDYSQLIRHSRIDLPDALSDRDQDNWEPLISIARSAGELWFNRAIAAALMLSNSGEKSVSVANQLLIDIQHIYAMKSVSRMSTANLISALIEDQEMPWATYNRGKPLTPSQLAKQLRPYNISSKTVRFGYSNTLKGYDLEQFSDAFSRYLAPADLLSQGNDSRESNNGMDANVTGDFGVTKNVGPTDAQIQKIFKSHSDLDDFAP